MVEQIATEMVSPLNLRRDERAEIELGLLLEAMARYGFCEFRFFNQAVLNRRVADTLRSEGLETISALQERILYNDRAFSTLAVAMTGGVTPLFGAPALLRAIRDCVVPLLKTYSFIRIWVPSAGTGGLAYSLACLLAEAGLLERSVIYATFLNDVTVSVAKAGLFPHDGRKRLESSAKSAGLQQPIDTFFTIDDCYAVPKESLRPSVMLGRHNLATDGSINEFHGIVSLGMVSLLNGAARLRAHELFFESLGRLGFLILGQDETLTRTAHEGAFRKVNPDHAIYRRMR